MTDTDLTGGCACGAVRFRLTETPFDTGWCHCTICQRVSGSGGMVFTSVHREALAFERGTERMRTYRSTSFGERTHCRDCGSPLTIGVDYQPDQIDIAVATLDDPNAVTPGFHLYASRAPAWMSLNDGLPAYPAMRPDTVGLKPGQTEP